jgi:hypothetical protein
MDIETFLSFRKLATFNKVEHARRVYEDIAGDLVQLGRTYQTKNFCACDDPTCPAAKAKRRTMKQINKMVLMIAFLLDDMNCTAEAQALALEGWADFLHDIHLPHLRS